MALGRRQLQLGRDLGQADQLSQQQLLKQILLLVPAVCRQLWRMAYVETLGYAEIARRIDVPPGTVKSRMWYCRKRALALLQEIGRESASPGPRVSR